MNSKLKAAVAVVALAVAGAASADPIPTEGLFLSLRDTVNNTSMVVNLGLTTTEFRGNPTASYTLGGDGLADLTAFLSSASLGGIRWNIQGASNGTFSSPLYGGLTTSTINPASQFQDWGISIVQNAVNSFTTFRNIVNTVDPVTSNPRLTNSQGYATTGLGAYFSIQQSAVGIPTLGNLGQALGFYSFFADQDDPDFTGASADMNGNWLLNFASGVASLTFASNAAPTVPVPAAVWLLASGVAGLFGVSRRRRVALAA